MISKEDKRCYQMSVIFLIIIACIYGCCPVSCGIPSTCATSYYYGNGTILSLYFANYRNNLWIRTWKNSFYLKKKKLSLNYSILVGAGSAGAVIANRLSENSNVSVLLIEAGDYGFDNENIRIPLAGGGLQKTLADWHYYTVPQEYSQKAMIDRVYIVK